LKYKYIYSCKLFLGSKTIIHPGVSIIAEAGPIFIGDGNLIEEQSVIANR
jgi:dynactin-6